VNKIQTFEQFLTNQSVQVDVTAFIVNVLLAAFLSFLLGRLYVRFGHSLSNRAVFARNFMLIAVTTMFIITVVKSSLALSLGLVGALSIVRFRAAIKEPEELAYLFLNIAIGLGMGADQRLITLVAFALVGGMIAGRGLVQRREEDGNLYLSIDSRNPEKVELGAVIATLKEHTAGATMKRFHETKEALEATFLVEFNDFDQLNETRSQLQALNENLTIRFLDLKGVHE
jgi:hypothetical protein